MKFLHLCVFIGAVVSSLPTPVEDEKRWCLAIGQSCWKLRRAAEAFSAVIRTSPEHTLETRDETVLDKTAKQQIDALAALIGNRQDDPSALFNGLNQPQPVTKKEKRAPWCVFDGEIWSCWSNDNKQDKPEILQRSSTTPETPADEKRWCLAIGQSCWKAKRAAQAVVDAIDETPPEEKKEEEKRWCLAIGQSCWKRSPKTVVDEKVVEKCNGPDGLCTKAARELELIRAVARDIIDTHTH
ncbi:hypothetical protein QBC46DRAFT_432574 [Diplogelasinospora grovesii]|uniref:Pheromone n=1 Tax=Diplogelasinospora grovesii TaxID=303347 RepID=A0AAN6N8F7_9PEZI|nr:hypothetical protein QBC46DRAFT_432574 [Diplogelasinospora grovesii]